MKYSVVFTVVFTLLMFLSPEARSQVKVDVKGKANREADNRANRATDRVIDAGFDKLEEGIKGVFKKKDKKEKTADQSEGTKEESAEAGENATAENASGRDKKPETKGAENVAKEASLTWAKYDFVPGDQVIFEDNLQNEQNGEFPSRWDLVNGNIEVAEFGGEKVIMMRDGQPTIVPYFKDPKEDHLPEVFTVEMDLCYPGGGSFEIYLYDRKNQESGSPSGYTDLQIGYGNNMRFASASSN